MDTRSIWSLALQDPVIKHNFGGVFPSDNLPKYKKQFNSYIINLDPSNKPGSHWIAVYFGKNICYYFCSYGTDPNENILKFIRHNAKYIEWNKSLFQSLYSTTCGLFCIYFLHKINNSEKLNLNPRNTTYNENIIKNYFHKNYIFRNNDSNPELYKNQTCHCFTKTYRS